MKTQKIPRPEYPRPQFVRKDWLNLNGQWQFEFDANDSGISRGVRDRGLSGSITVPFCPESTLSGVGDVDFHAAVWYRKEVKIPAGWKKYPRLRLHFQACDYETTVWVNGTEIVRHRGGFTPFFAEIGGLVKAGGKAVIVVRARDNDRMALPRGKQCGEYSNVGCAYTRTTGIWQTVWLEPLPAAAMERPRITPDLANSRFRFEVPFSGCTTGLKIRAVVSDRDGEIASKCVAADADFSAAFEIAVPAKRLHLWEPGNAYLYDIVFELVNAKGEVVDKVASYAGMRSVRLDGMAVRINGKSVFQRQVLDQGYYADGIMTAPTDAALVRDIKLSMAAGFNSARLHQKVFEERFLYHCDRLGYMVWGEFGDWGTFWGEDGVLGHRHQPAAAIAAQWQEVLLRDYSHTAIIGWCPLNETWQPVEDRMVALDDTQTALYYSTKACDRTRPVLDSSGYAHRIRNADVFDCHNYEQDPEKFRKVTEGTAEGKPYVNGLDRNIVVGVPYAGQPYFVSEFGGIKWNPSALDNSKGSWGYGNSPKTIEEFYARFKGLCDVLLDNPAMFGYCYTQLTDVFQEQNGIYFFDRSAKFDMKRIRAIQTRTAAIEKIR